MNPSQWTTKQWVAALGSLFAGVALVASALDEFRTVAEAFPLATKSWVLSQNDALTRSINNLEWSTIRDRAEKLRSQIPDDQFKLIQLQDSVAAEPPPGDIEKRQLIRQLEDRVEKNKRQLDKLDCQLDKQFGGGDPASC